METKDLRIGNYVSYLGEPQKVLGIGEKYIYIRPYSYLLCVDINEVEPIPITEEWLKKLGFVIIETNKGIECFYFGNRYSVFQPAGKLAWLFVDDEKGLCEVKHVHQLQNLYFSLTGEELKLI